MSNVYCAVCLYLDSGHSIPNCPTGPVKIVLTYVNGYAVCGEHAIWLLEKLVPFYSLGA